MHAATFVRAKDRDGLARLIRYGARWPFTLDTFSLLEDGNVCYSLKKPWGPHGITNLVLSPVDFLRRYATLIPPPYLNMTRYFGILAPNAKRRHEIVPTRIKVGHAITHSDVKAKTEAEQQDKDLGRTYVLHSSSKTPAAPPLLKPPAQPLTKGKQPSAAEKVYPSRVHGRIPWADLIRFTFFEDLKTCTCGGVMTLIAAISCAQTQVITKILQHLDIPVDISEPLSARLPSQLSLEWEEVEWV